MTPFLPPLSTLRILCISRGSFRLIRTYSLGCICMLPHTRHVGPLFVSTHHQRSDLAHHPRVLVHLFVPFDALLLLSLSSPHDEIDNTRPHIRRRIAPIRSNSRASRLDQRSDPSVSHDIHRARFRALSPHLQIPSIPRRPNQTLNILRHLGCLLRCTASPLRRNYTSRDDRSSLDRRCSSTETAFPV